MENESYTKEEIELLDRFAGLAMNAILSRAGSVGIGESSYNVAKEMLKARKEALKNV